MGVEEKLMAQLDRYQPNWWIDWADQQDLKDIQRGMASQDTVRTRCIRKVWIIFAAAQTAGLITCK